MWRSMGGPLSVEGVTGKHVDTWLYIQSTLLSSCNTTWTYHYFLLLCLHSSVRVWDVHKGILLHTLTGHTEEIEVSHLMVTLQKLIADLATYIYVAMAMINFTNCITEKNFQQPCSKHRTFWEQNGNLCSYTYIYFFSKLWSKESYLANQEHMSYP